MEPKPHPLVGIMIIFAGTTIFYYGYIQLQKVQTLLETGTRTQAEIVKIDYISPQKPGGTTSYIPIVRWTSTNGQAVVSRAQFSSPQKSSYTLGAAYDVIYDPAAPEDRYYVLESGSNASPGFFDYIFCIIGMVFVLGGLYHFKSAFSKKDLRG